MSVSSNGLRKICIVFVASLFALLNGSGYYGFGADFYNAYINHNFIHGGWADRIGWWLSTLSIADTHIGVHLTSAVCATYAGTLLNEYFKFHRINSVLLYLFMLVIAIHTWPIIMSTSNAMRQGIAMSIIWFYLLFWSWQKHKTAIFFLIISLFTHKSALIFLVVFAATVICRKLESLYRRSPLVPLSTAFILASSGYIFLTFKYPLGVDTVVIAGDYRLPFAMINIGFIAVFLTNRRLRESVINTFLFFFSSIALVLVVNGLGWQYERLNMMMLLLYITQFGSMLRQRPSFYLTVVLLSLLVATILTGMFDSLK